MTEEYPAGYVLMIKVLDGIILLCGLTVVLTPIILHFFPGAYDTMLHEAFGALICVCAVFRVLIAYGSAWLEVVLGALGLLVVLQPWYMHEMYDPRYNDGHLIVGGIIIGLAIISGISTAIQLRKRGGRAATG